MGASWLHWGAAICGVLGILTLLWETYAAAREAQKRLEFDAELLTKVAAAGSAWLTSMDNVKEWEDLRALSDKVKTLRTEAR